MLEQVLVDAAANRQPTAVTRRKVVSRFFAGLGIFGVFKLASLMLIYFVVQSPRRTAVVNRFSTWTGVCFVIKVSFKTSSFMNTESGTKLARRAI